MQGVGNVGSQGRAGCMHTCMTLATRVIGLNVLSKDAGRVPKAALRTLAVPEAAPAAIPPPSSLLNTRAPTIWEHWLGSARRDQDAYRLHTFGKYQESGDKTPSRSLKARATGIQTSAHAPPTQHAHTGLCARLRAGTQAACWSLGRGLQQHIQRWALPRLCPLPQASPKAAHHPQSLLLPGKSAHPPLGPPMAFTGSCRYRCDSTTASSCARLRLICCICVCRATRWRRAAHETGRQAGGQAGRH